MSVTTTTCFGSSNVPVTCPCNATHHSGACDERMQCAGSFCVIRDNKGEAESGCLSFHGDFQASCSDVYGLQASVRYCCCHDNCTEAPAWNVSAASLATLPTGVLATGARYASSATAPIGGVGISVGVTAAMTLVVLLLALVTCTYARRGSLQEPDADGSTGSSVLAGKREEKRSCLSSSRSGSTEMVHRGLGNVIKLESTLSLGSGGCGIVYRGTWRDRQVAIKCVTDEHAFRWEHTLLSTFNLTHKAIITFYGADVLYIEPLPTQYWLVLEYYPFGTLQRYLREDAFGRADEAVPIFSDGHLTCAGEIPPAPVRFQAPCIHADSQLESERRWELLRLVQSLVNGVDYLHTALSHSRPPRHRGLSLRRSSVHVTSRVHCLKPSIAHCDLKSASVLVRMDRSCCIADFGQAVFLDADSNTVQRPAHLSDRSGSTRQMAPECLDGTGGDTMQAYLQQDIYSLGLILWEIANCVPTLDCPAASYSLPYQVETHKGNPSVEDMRKVVCDAGVRPSIHAHWRHDETLRELSSIMTSCWQAQPDKRPQSSILARQLTTRQLTTRQLTTQQLSSQRVQNNSM